MGGVHGGSEKGTGSREWLSGPFRVNHASVDGSGCSGLKETPEGDASVRNFPGT